MLTTLSWRSASHSRFLYYGEVAAFTRERDVQETSENFKAHLE